MLLRCIVLNRAFSNALRCCLDHACPSHAVLFISIAALKLSQPNICPRSLTPLYALLHASCMPGPFLAPYRLTSPALHQAKLHSLVCVGFRLYSIKDIYEGKGKSGGSTFAASFRLFYEWHDKGKEPMLYGKVRTLALRNYVHQINNSLVVTAFAMQR